ncbi:hypothetical protein [Alicyclobacillus suci]
MFNDANLDVAVQNTALCKMRGMGETCVSTNRCLIGLTTRVCLII